MYVQKSIRLSLPLAQALKKGAHRVEKSQREFILEAIFNALQDLGDERLAPLLSAHAALDDEPKPKRGRPPKELPEQVNFSQKVPEID